MPCTCLVDCLNALFVSIARHCAIYWFLVRKFCNKMPSKKSFNSFDVKIFFLTYNVSRRQSTLALRQMSSFCKGDLFSLVDRKGLRNLEIAICLEQEFQPKKSIFSPKLINHNLLKGFYMALDDIIFLPSFHKLIYPNLICK